MKIKAMLIATLIAFIQPVSAEEEMYDLGHKLATCSGDFSQMSNMLVILNQDADAKVSKQKSNGWKVAAVVSFMADKMKPKIAWSAAEGIHDTTVSRWEALLETTNKQTFISKFKSGDDKEFGKSFDELMSNVTRCTFYGDLVELSIKLYRKSIQ